MSEKAARVHSDLIRPATQLLYLAGGSECHGGYEYITWWATRFASEIYCFGLSAGFCCCCVSSVHGGTIPFVRA